MSNLGVDDVRHALTLARANGSRQVEISVGDASFSATLGPRPKGMKKSAGPVPTANEPEAKTEVATMVGYFRATVKPGDAVAAGGKIGAIMALGIANDVFAEHGGTVAEVLVEDEGAVQYGQPLLRYESTAESAA